MPDSQREVILTRTTLLELKDEERLAKEGYELLDEKRILLAADILRRLKRVSLLCAQLAEAEKAARGALRAALVRHGIDELEVYPPLSMQEDGIETRRSRLLGLEVIEARWRPTTAVHPAAGERSVCPSPEASACAAAYRACLASIVELAACCVSLRRLAREYVRTERRTRSIENVLLPELRSLLALLEEQLESLDQEEIARLREASARHDPGGGFTSSNR